MDPDLLDSLPVAEETTDDTSPPDDKTPEGEQPPEGKAPEGKQPDGKEPEGKQPETKPAPKEKDKVPLATFLEQKSKFERQQAEMRSAFERQQAELKAELEKLKNPPKPPPKYEEDPTGYIKSVTDESAQKVIAKLEESQKTLQSVQQTTEQQRAAIEEQRFFTELQSAEASFVQAQPDYYDALQFVRNVRVKQLETLTEAGLANLSEDQIIEQIRKEEAGLAFNAMRAGKNPSEIVYRLAGNYGYQQKKPELKVPDIQQTRKLDPDMTLGKSSGGAPNPADDSPDPESWDPFDAAIGELFGKKR